MTEEPTYKQLQQRLEDLEREVTYLRADASKIQSAFLSNISHEVRTPLNAIVGFANLVAEDNLSADEKKELANYIKDSSDSLLEMVNNLIDISLIQAGKLQLKSENCFTDGIIDEVIRKFVPLHPGYKIIHHPCQDGYLIFKSDKTRLVQLLNNLLQFISQYSSKGELKISFKATDDRINFEIKILGNYLESAKKELLVALNSLKNSDNPVSISLAIQASVFMANVLEGELAVVETWEDDWGIVFSIPKQQISINKTRLQLINEFVKKNIAL
jgi:K+-sensing histidine kinase KdpD